MKYAALTTADQRAILEQRLRQYEADHFSHAINKDLLVASGATDDATKQAIKQADEAMATLDKAHAEVTKKLAAMPAPTPPAR